ncbi:MAG: regulatory protein RecX [Firmicutes bacterium]|nr:regulatory protein RecX [Bacillota bacterium]
MDKRTCMEACLAKLNYRMRTESELRGAMKGLGYEGDEISETLEELKSFGYVDDERYVREFYRTSRRKNWSKNRIVNALREKGIAASFAKEVLDEFEASSEFADLGLETDERAVALEVGEAMASTQISRGKHLDESFLKKVGRRLTSLGYDPGCCYYVINRLRAGAVENDHPEDDL